MLSDRSYMRSDYPRPTVSALTWILCATLAGAVLQFILSRLGNESFPAFFALSTYGISEWRIWTLATYVLLHDGLLHLLLNGLGLFLIGREVAPLLGSRRFVQFYLGSAVLGGLCWLTVDVFAGGNLPLVGASACVVAMLILFACIYPEREITFLLFLILPVTLKPKVIAWGLVIFEMLGLLFGELPGSKIPTNIAHSAHLGGALAGWLYFRYVYAAAGWDRAPGLGFEWPAWLRRRKDAPKSVLKPGFRPDAPAPRNLRAEVDRILDKINSQGFGALTDDEKRLLDEAKDMLSRH